MDDNVNYTDTKFCHACGQDLWVGQFGKNRSKPDGLQNQCKSCRSERQRNSREYKEYQKDYVAKNKSQLSQRAKSRYANNPEPAKLRAAQWRASNPERKKELDRAWAKSNRERANENSRNWASKNRDKRRAIQKKYAEGHKETLRIKAVRRRAMMQSVQSVKYTEDQLLGKLLVHGYSCYLCSKPLDESIEWDHVKPIVAGGPDMLSNLSPTHQSCNRSKGGKWPLGKVR